MSSALATNVHGGQCLHHTKLFQQEQLDDACQSHPDTVCSIELANLAYSNTIVAEQETVVLTLMLMLATPVYTVPPGLAVLTGLQGCWRISGQVQGKESPSIARGEWHLGRRYFTLHLRATGPDPYEAAITYGAGEQPRAIGSVFSDTFGGLYEPSLGLGELEQGGFVQRYRFSDATYVNRFSRSGTGWRWNITEEPMGKPPAVFADYHLRPASCRGMKFDY